MNRLYRFLSFFIFFVLVSASLRAQDNVGIGTSSPNANALLDLSVPNPGTNPMGLMLPRLRGSERMAFTSGLNNTTDRGIIVYDLDLDMALYWDGNNWQSAASDNLGKHELDSNLKTNDFWLSNDGSDQGIFVAPSGRVGIGTDNPGDDLNIDGTSTTGMTITSDIATSGFAISYAGIGEAMVRNRENTNLGLYTNNIRRINISNSGAVEIEGENNVHPGRLFTVEGGRNGTTEALVQNTVNGAAADATMSLQSSAGYLIMEQNSTTKTGNFGSQSIAGQSIIRTGVAGGQAGMMIGNENDLPLDFVVDDHVVLRLIADSLKLGHNLGDYYTLPVYDGDAGQVLVTDGSHNTNWDYPQIQFIESFSDSLGPNASVHANGIRPVSSVASADLVLQPKGVGAIITTVPDNVLEGSKRGSYAIDLQLSRTTNTEVASGQYSTISGGWNNMASNTGAVVAGGQNNYASGQYSAVLGGRVHRNSGDQSAIVGGSSNEITGENSFIGGGTGNRVTANQGVIGGGNLDTVEAIYGVIGGGNSNAVKYTYGTIGGGLENKILDDYGTIAGGRENITRGYAATIGGGLRNEVFDSYGTISGGRNNEAIDFFSTVGGGDLNRANGRYALVGGGYQNRALAEAATVVGGEGNRAAAFGETVLGTYNDSATTNNKTQGTVTTTDRLFTIGNGDNGTNRSNALTMRRDGRTVIGDDEFYNARLNIASEAGENPLYVRIDGTIEGLWNDNGGLAVGAGITPPSDGLYVHGRTAIGTSTAAAMLEVRSDAATLDPLRVEQYGGAVAMLVHDNRGVSINSAAEPNAGDLYVNGDVGIGTWDAEARLHISGNTNTAAPHLTLEETGFADWARMRFNSTYTSGTNHTFGIAGRPHTTLSEAKLYFSYTDGVGTLTDHFTMTGEGLFGMGKTDPEAKLHIDSDNTVAEPTLILEDSYAGADYVRVHFKNNETTASGHHWLMSADPDNNSLFSADFNITYIDGTGTDQELFRIDADGHVGINENIPQRALHVKGKNDSRVLRLESTGDMDYWDLGYSTATANYLRIYFGTNERGYFRDNDGQYFNVSDDRLKKNVEQITEPILPKLKDMNIYKYNYLDHEEGTEKTVGVMAQEALQVMPGIVSQPEHEGDHYGVAYSTIAVYNLKAIKELNQKLERTKSDKSSLQTLDSTMQALEAKVEALENENADLKSQLEEKEVLEGRLGRLEAWMESESAEALNKD